MRSRALPWEPPFCWALPAARSTANEAYLRWARARRLDVISGSCDKSRGLA